MISTIRNRLYFGLTTAILLVMAVALLSYQTFKRNNYETALIKHSYRVLNQLEEIQKLAVDMETSRRGFRSTNESKFLNRYFSTLPKIEPALKDLRELLTTNATQIANLDRVNQKLQDVLTFWLSLGNDASLYTRNQVLEINTSEQEKMDAFRMEIEHMIDVEQEVLANREKANESFVIVASWELIIGISLIIIIVLILINLILKEFKSRSEVQQELQNNNLELEAVNKESKDRNWLLAGMAEVNNNLQGSEEIKDLSRAVLDTLVTYLNAQAGAFYLYDDDKKALCLVAANALPNQVQKEFRLNEGLVGQSAVKKNPAVIKNITQQYTISSGTFSANPSEVIYTPIWLHNELKGVIELLSFTTFNEQSINFLKVVRDNIAVALHSSQAKEKVIRLLEQVQKQTETLENQQEELRQAYEDLSLQTESLQASEEELKVQEEELRQINAELEDKNKAVENARQALLVKAQELQITSKYKSEFLANMSHELRTPLNSILILAKLLAENKQRNLTTKQIEHSKIIYKSGSDLLDLINDILDLSKIEAGKVALVIEPVKVKNIADDVEQLFRVIADEKSINFKVSIGNDVPEIIRTDKQKLEQVLRNILSNAFKFTGAGGFISLSFSLMKQYVNDSLAISIADTGIGIVKEKQQTIFEAFQQADMSTSRKYGGTGLGLSITKELLKLLQGSVELESEEGKGSTFTIILPLKTLPEQADDASFINNIETKETLVADDRSNLNAEKKLLLIIEDDIDFAVIVKNLANDHGYDVVIATRGDEGLEYAKQYKPDAIILDVKLPVMDGRTVLKELKSIEALKHIPVHIISATEENKFVIPGAFAYLKKPVRKQDIEAVFATIDGSGNKTIKQVLLISGDEKQDTHLQQLILQRHLNVKGEYVTTVQEAIDRFSKRNFDCVIADLGWDIAKGLNDLEYFNQHVKGVPIIVYVNDDITQQNELELMKVSNVVVRSSSQSSERLMDEMELFLYQVNDQSGTNQNGASINSTSNGDTSLEGKKILVVDDDMRNVFAITELLEQEQMEIYTAGDGKEALESLQSNMDIDIVLMDIMMPEMDGYEAMQHIRKNLAFSNLPIIALTAKAMAGDREKCIEAGASDYITKPVDGQKLRSLLRVWLSK